MYHLYEIVLESPQMWLKIQASCWSEEQAKKFFTVRFYGYDAAPLPRKLSECSEYIFDWEAIKDQLPNEWDTQEFYIAEGPYPWCKTLSDDCDCYGEKGSLGFSHCSDWGLLEEKDKRAMKSQNIRHLNCIQIMENIIAERDETWREQRASSQQAIYAAAENANKGGGHEKINDPMVRSLYTLVDRGFYCQIEGRHHAFSENAKLRTLAALVALEAQLSTFGEEQRNILMPQIGTIITLWLRQHQAKECAERSINGEADIPNILYKYIPRGRIGHGAPDSLRATQLLALNDDMECNIAANNYNNKLGTLEFLDLVQSKLVEHLGITVPRHELLERSLSHVDPMLSTFIQQYLNSRVGVVSFSTDPLVPTMWAHYAQSTGIVAGYDTEALRQMGLELRPIIYSEIAPSYEPAKDDVIRLSIVDQEQLEQDARVGKARAGYGILCQVDLTEFSTDWKALSRMLFVKGASWSYEKEIRLLVDLEKTRDVGKVDDNGWPVKVIDPPTEAIKEIYGGTNTREADRTKAAEVARGTNHDEWHGLLEGRLSAHAFRIQKTGGTGH